MYSIIKWTVFLICCVLGLLGFTHFQHHKKMQRMTFFYEKGFYEKSREELIRINEKKMAYPFAMYQAYLSIGEKNYQQAKLFLEKATAFSYGKDLLLDRELNAFALCCHLINHDQEGMERCLKQFPVSSYQTPLFLFVQGAYSYENEAYLEAVKAWKQLNYYLLQQELTPWGKIAFQQLYPKEVFELNLASSLIEVECYFEAREILEQFLCENTSFSLQQNAYLYLGYSYLKEAFSSQVNSLKLAAFYFDKVHFDDLAQTQKNQILLCLDEMIGKTLNEKTLSYEKLAYLIFPLERWKQEKKIEQIQDSLVLRLENNQEQDMDFFKSFQKIAPSQFFLSLQNTLFAKLQLSLDNASTTFSSIWNMLSSNPEMASQTSQMLLAQMLSRLDQLIAADSEDLSLFQTQIKMLEQKQLSKEQLSVFSLPLYALATQLWMVPQEEKKATLLMQLSYKLATNKSMIKTKIENFLLPLFDRAQEANLIERLTKIFDAMMLFHITPKCIDHPTTIANHLEDASYRYHCQHFVQAKALCTWVLKLEPNNQLALKILGLSCYFLGDFEEACCFLNQLEFQDDQTEKARVLSEVLGGKNKSELVIQRAEIED